jgi:hypothetical protein
LAFIRFGGYVIIIAARLLKLNVGYAGFGFIRFGGYVIIIGRADYLNQKWATPIWFYPLWRICYNNRQSRLFEQEVGYADLALSALADML